MTLAFFQVLLSFSIAAVSGLIVGITFKKVKAQREALRRNQALSAAHLEDRQRASA